MQFKRSDFPPGFVFAAATSSYQIEGHAFGGAGSTHWDTFAATPGNVVRGEDGARACDHYHRYEEDLDLMQAAGFDAYRFSTSWARVMPEGRGAPNADGLDFYDRLVDAMCARNLKPMATLYHWELPAKLADLGGWRNPDICHWFAEFAEVIVNRIGDRLYSVAPVNEPYCITWLGHLTGDHAPGQRDIRSTAHAMHHVLKAHGSAIEVMRGLGQGNLGGVFNCEHAIPASDSAEDLAAAQRQDEIYNHFFLSGVCKGTYPAAVLEGLEPYLPTGWQDDLAGISQPLDWVGINYYTCKRIAHSEGPWPGLADAPGPGPKTQMGWEIYPDGLKHFLLMVDREYTRGLPLYITENGMANADLPGVEDTARISYLDAHIAAAKAAMDAGVPLAGYTFWSLLDNYEWSLGYEKRFGLIHVDFETLKRTPKTSYDKIAEALRA
ncbi:MAG: GH1 family beta-glucosidase [Pseudomonadota bacterium]